MLRHWRTLLLLLALALPQAGNARPSRELVRLEITSRALAFDGESFGDAGQYERIAAVAHLRIDPLAPVNRKIVDLALAPRDAQGLVAYDVDVMILRPREAAKASRVLLFDVVNRGFKTAGVLNGGGIAAGNPISRGDALLMRHGVTVLWAGWQGDIAGTASIGARFPVVTDRGRPVTGPAIAEAVFDSAKANRIALGYPAASQDQSSARLTVRAVTGGPVRTIGPDQWRFENDRSVTVTRPADMDAGAIYRFEYVARDPKVMGLGFAAVRDVVSFIRHGTAAQGNPLADIAAAPCARSSRGACVNPGGGAFASTIAIGLSQSGRYLRDFLWQDFNRDLAGRKVFDGVMAMIPGGRRTFTNMRFGEPGRFSRQHEDHDVPGFTFPYAYATLRDPVTGVTDGILRACTATRTCPKVMHFDTSAEFWQAGASLVGTGGTAGDVAFPLNVRAYMLAGGAHAPGMGGAPCLLPPNPMNYAPYQRAMFAAMLDWTLDRRAPPPSRWPSLAKGELQPITALRGPAAPARGLTWPKVLNRPTPPAGRPDWPIFVPAIDADGNDLPGIRPPQLTVPTGTLLGWNLRKRGYGEGDLCLLAGSFVPFAPTAAVRADDPRPSLAERHPSPEAREAKVRRTVDTLVDDRLLLDDDREAVVRASIR